MIQRSCIAGKWENEQSQIDRTLLLRWVCNKFSHHIDDIDFQLQYGGRFAATYPASLEKHQLGAKATKMTTLPHIINV